MALRTPGGNVGGGCLFCSPGGRPGPAAAPEPLPICMPQGSRVDRSCGPFSLPPASRAHVWGRALKHDYLDTFPARILSLALSGLGREMAGVFKMGAQDKNLQSFEAIY